MSDDYENTESWISPFTFEMVLRPWSRGKLKNFVVVQHTRNTDADANVFHSNFFSGCITPTHVSKDYLRNRGSSERLAVLQLETSECSRCRQMWRKHDKAWIQVEISFFPSPFNR